MGGPAEKDGIVLDFNAFGINENSAVTNMGKRLCMKWGTGSV